MLWIRLTGTADFATQSAVQALLSRAHAETIRTRVPEVAVDFTGLELMSSSCFRCFVSWVSDVRDLPLDQQYRIRLVCDQAILWQRRSMHALKSFADDLIRIER